MCQCKSVAFGTYLNTVGMVPPAYSRMKKYLDQERKEKKNQFVCIDTCIASEIGWLWHQEVITLNSCCGHNQANAWVIVHSRSVDLMKRLGYQSQSMMLKEGLRVTDVSVRPRETFLLKNI